MVDSDKVVIEYQGGTLALRNLPEGVDVPAGGLPDSRDGSLRFEGFAYPQVLRWLVRAKIPYEDRARAYEELTLHQRVRHQPFPYQQEALDAWVRQRRAGVVILPTGAGKSYLAVLAIEHVQRSTLVVVPTLDLVSQWYDVLTRAFGVEVGVVGGGDHDLRSLTVTTYDSAYMHAERFGARFGLVVYDECHHLPGESFLFAARASIAPFRLGLTATLERADGRHHVLDEMVGPVAYRREIPELSGEYLSGYDTVTLRVELDEAERESYEEARATYTGFVRSRGIAMGSSDGWRRFLIESSRSSEGRKAFQAYRRQKELAMGATGKLRVLEGLMHQHRQERMLIFTQDNATAYAIARRFLVPIITHHTKPKERSAILAGLRQGRFGAVVTSKVLNEGVDVPEANIAVILSGSGSVREHVQRLGRILRRMEGKQAVLYEVISASTAEEWVSQRRREHGAYRQAVNELPPEE
jgi:superfamily II DNA or RNA helicase